MAVALLAMSMMGARSAWAQGEPVDEAHVVAIEPDRRAECGAAVNGVALSLQVAASVAATAVEYRSMTPRATWHLSRDAQRARIVADPSSHLHFVGSYHLARTVVRPACADSASRTAAVWGGAALSLAVGISKEVADGFYNGFSPTDLAINAIGIGYAVAQGYVPVLQHVTPTFSVSARAFRGPDGVPGAVTHYAHQTFWLSANVGDMLPAASARAWPAPLRLSVGRRAFSGGATPSEYVLGLDLDAAKLPGSHPAWLTAKRVLHQLRLPGPALVLKSSGASVVGLYW